ncbi:MAG: AMP-binding protein, partial [Rhodobacterales bacterium]
MKAEEIPDRTTCVLRYILDRRAVDTPDKIFAVTPDGEEMTYREMHTEVRRLGRAFQDMGIKQGDYVSIWMPTSLETITIWYALNYIGATCVLMNTGYRGGVLEHVLHNSSSKVMFAHPTLAKRLADVDTALIDTVVVTGDDAPDLPSLNTTRMCDLDSNGEVLPLSKEIEPWDTQAIIYTSGTTGPSKGVMSTYCHLHTMAMSVFSTRENELMIGQDDRFMINMPLFHAGGAAPSYGMLALGGSIALLETFKTDTFWRDVRNTQSTIVILLGVMTSFLMKQPTNADDKAHCLKNVIVIPLTADGVNFRNRFGVNLHTKFNMSETSCPIIAEVNPTTVNVCGKARKGVELRLVDAHDCQVPKGQVGELVIRTDQPWAMTHAYLNNPQATADAFRNGWFHTGDAFRQDEDGNYFFVDRFKDAIRRRGENVSSYEVEAEVVAHPAVREAAVVAVDSEHSEDDILVAISFVEGQSVEPAGDEPCPGRPCVRHGRRLG